MVSRVSQKPSSDPAREGVCAAWLAEMMINGHFESANELIGQKCPDNQWVIDVDMAHHVTRYVNMVRTQYGVTVRAEKFVRLNQNIAGTCDAWALATFIDDRRTLVVIDLKFGFGVVEVYQNTQLSIYAAAMLREIESVTADMMVRLVIFQPRAFHPHGHTRTWTVPVNEFLQFVAGIETAGAACQADDPVTIAGPHCHNCDAAATCASLAASNYRSYERAMSSQQRHMSPVELAAELKFLEEATAMMDARWNEVRAEAEARIKRGETIFGYGLVRGRGQRRLKYDAASIKAATGVDATSDKIVTPAELLRRVKSAYPVKGVDHEAIVDTLSESTDGAVRLSALLPNHAHVAFGQD
jgi:hypothetical protein